MYGVEVQSWSWTCVAREREGSPRRRCLPDTDDSFSQIVHPNSLRLDSRCLEAGKALVRPSAPLTDIAEAECIPILNTHRTPFLPLIVLTGTSETFSNSRGTELLSPAPEPLVGKATLSSSTRDAKSLGTRRRCSDRFTLLERIVSQINPLHRRRQAFSQLKKDHSLRPTVQSRSKTTSRHGCPMRPGCTPVNFGD